MFQSHHRRLLIRHLSLACSDQIDVACLGLHHLQLVRSSSSTLLKWNKIYLNYEILMCKGIFAYVVLADITFMCLWQLFELIIGAT
jgi:hypothetical protein